MFPKIAFTLLFVALPLCALSQEQKQQETSKTAQVSGAGCTRAGVEGGCIVLEDSKTKKLYNLFFTGDKPQLDTAISFVGQEHDGPTTCMQGLPVQVSKWTPLKMKCPKPASGTTRKKPSK